MQTSSSTSEAQAEWRSDGVAWPTVALAAGTLSAWLGVWTAVLADLVPLGLGALLNFVFAYVAFTPLHEAAHGNVNGSRKDMRWLNEAVGWLSGILLIAPHPPFRTLHLRHHGATNDPERDPDYWVASGRPLGVALRCATIIGKYYHAYVTAVFEGSPGAAKSRRGTLLGMGLGLAALAALVAAGLGVEALMLWVLPALAAMPLLAFFFDWLPHHPHAVRGRYRDTRVVALAGLTVPLLCQNYHLIHHLYPRLPFYRYPASFRARREELRSNGAEVVERARARSSHA